MVSLLGPAVIAVLAAQGTPSPALSTERLPGFQIDLPGGDSRQAEIADYRVGRLLVGAPGKLTVQVKWMPGSSLEKGTGNEAAMAAGVSALLGAEAVGVERDNTVVVPGGLPNHTWKLQMRDGRQVSVTAVICGARRINVSTAVTIPGIETLHGRMLRSFQCRPDPTKQKEVALVDVPVVVDLPPGWQRAELGVGRLALTNGPSIFLVTSLGANVKGEALTKMLPALVTSKFRIGEREGADWLVEVRPSGGIGRVTVLPCPEAKQTLLLISVVDGDTKRAEAAGKLLRKARCRRPDEPAQRWPMRPQPGGI